MVFDLFKRSASAQDELPEGWKHLSSLDELDAAWQRSEHLPVAFFKHSTRCGISRMVLREFIQQWQQDAPEVELFYLDLLQHRAISQAIAQRSGVVHESPQVVLVQAGQVLHHASHHSISVAELRKALGNA
ncbi:MAG: bacillithiol system redox-active protein YtxJ [Flavobacteriales bacterium]|nr:bacillithiol system redox-active protein YtxJ [Flavobacteriales bacterium]